MEAIPFVLPKIISTKQRLLEKKLFSSVEIIVVDDASEDKSLRILEDAVGIRVEKHSSRLGYGASLKRGILCSQSRYIAFLDMDDTYNPYDFISMVEHAHREYDFIVGVRQTEIGMPWIRRMGNEFFRRVIALCFGTRLSDPCSGMWLCHREKIASMLHQLPDGLHFSLKMSLMILHHSKQLSEVSVSYNERKGQSKLFVIGDGFRFLFEILRFRLERFERSN